MLLFVWLKIFPLFFVLLSTTDYKTVLKQFSDIIIVISLISLFFFVFATCLQVIKPTMRFISNWGGLRWVDNYYFVYSEMQSLTSFSYSGYRNTAIWVEGPMLAFPVCMALNYEVLLTEKLNKFRIGILLITIITSFSTTGMILSIIIFGIKFFVENKIKKLFLWVIIPTVIVIMFWSINFLLADKMLKSITSYNIHFDDISATLKCFCDNPFFGIGYNNVRGLVAYHQVRRISAGLSTGLGGVLAYGGILWAVWYLVPFFISIRRFVKYKDLRDKSGFVIIFTILLALVIVQETALCMMFNAINWKLIFNMKGRLNES